MNWKRIITASAGVVVVIAISVLCTKACSESRNSDSINAARDQIANARKAIKEVGDTNKVLRDSVAMWRDSVEFYKKGLEDCEGRKSAKAPKNDSPKPVARPVNPSKPRVQPKPQPQPRDTVYVVCKDAIKGHVTDIDLNADARNNQNIIVQNAAPIASSDTKITLGEGATNNGNIVVNNGGNVKINDNRQALDSLRIAIDSLKRGQGTSAAASSVILVKKVKTYTRTR